MSVLSFQNRPGYSLHASAGLQGAGAYLYRTEYHCEAAGAVAGGGLVSGQQGSLVTGCRWENPAGVKMVSRLLQLSQVHSAAGYCQHLSGQSGS